MVVAGTSTVRSQKASSTPNQLPLVLANKYKLVLQALRAVRPKQQFFDEKRSNALQAS
jgi:hypothetical protein